jgi:hypothetical protein
MIEITLEGLNKRQRVLADIMWSIEDYDQVERFIKSLPKREASECRSIMQMMRMELVENYREAMNIEENDLAKSVIDKIRKL